jgi:hypothetical protein
MKRVYKKLDFVNMNIGTVFENQPRAFLMVRWVFTEVGVHQSGFSLKQVFTEHSYK